MNECAWSENIVTKSASLALLFLSSAQWSSFVDVLTAYVAAEVGISKPSSVQHHEQHLWEHRLEH